MNEQKYTYISYTHIHIHKYCAVASFVSMKHALSPSCSIDSTPSEGRLVLQVKRGGGKMAWVIAFLEWLGILLGFFPCGLLDPSWPRVKSVIGLLMALIAPGLFCIFTVKYVGMLLISFKSVACNIA